MLVWLALGGQSGGHVEVLALLVRQNTRSSGLKQPPQNSVVLSRVTAKS